MKPSKCDPNIIPSTQLVRSISIYYDSQNMAVIRHLMSINTVDKQQLTLRMNLQKINGNPL